MEFTNSTCYARRKHWAENGHWKLHSPMLIDLMVGVLDFIAQNYFRRLAPKQLFWVMVEVAVIHSTCRAQKAGFLDSKPEMTHAHLYHLLGACPNTPGLGRLPIPPASPHFLATGDSGIIAFKRELNCWFMLKKFGWGHRHGCSYRTYIALGMFTPSH